MAKIVIAGSADCPHFAKVELLADDLAKNLPNFKLHKIVKPSNDWAEWSRHCCRERGWAQQQQQQRSPIIWRELVNQGGKGVLIGGANEFQEFAKAYYDFESSKMSPEMLAVAKDNARYKEELDAEVARLRSLSQPLQVLVTAAASPAVYQLLPLLMDGSVFGRNTELAFTLFDCGLDHVDELEGLVMEAVDTAHPLVRSIRAVVDFSAAVAEADVLLLLDELLLPVSPPAPQPPTTPQAEGGAEDKTPPEDDKEGAEAAASAEADEAAAAAAAEAAARSDWLERNAQLYKRYADWLSAGEFPDRLRVLLAGRGPVNFGARVLLESCPRLSAKNVAAASRLFERQAKGALAAHLKVPPSSVADLIVWGDPAGENLVDLGRARIHHYDGAITGPDPYSQPALDTVWDRKWLGQEFPRLVRQRQSDNLRGEAARGAALSAAQATADTVRGWWLGNGGCNEIYSLGVMSDGCYGVPPGLVFSFPVRFHPKGYWSVIEDVDLSEEASQKLRQLAEAAQRDYELVFPPPAAPEADGADDSAAAASDTGDIDLSGELEQQPAEELAVDRASVELLRERLQSLSLPELSADSLLKLTPRLVEELLAVGDAAELRARLQQLEEAPLTTVDEEAAGAAAATGEEAGEEEEDEAEQGRDEEEEEAAAAEEEAAD